jgi:hypothetical protein
VGGGGEEVRKRETVAQVGYRENGDRRGARGSKVRLELGIGCGEGERRRSYSDY